MSTHATTETACSCVVDAAREFLDVESFQREASILLDQANEGKLAPAAFDCGITHGG